MPRIIPRKVVKRIRSFISNFLPSSFPSFPSASESHPQKGCRCKINIFPGPIWFFFRLQPFLWTVPSHYKVTVRHPRKLVAHHSLIIFPPLVGGDVPRGGERKYNSIKRLQPVILWGGGVAGATTHIFCRVRGEGKLSEGFYFHPVWVTIGSPISQSVCISSGPLPAPPAASDVPQQTADHSPGGGWRNPQMPSFGFRAAKPTGSDEKNQKTHTTP